jgi:hypothetical protein
MTSLTHKSGILRQLGGTMPGDHVGEAFFQLGLLLIIESDQIIYVPGNEQIQIVVRHLNATTGEQQEKNSNKNKNSESGKSGLY